MATTKESFSSFVKGETILELEGTYEYPHFFLHRFGIYDGLTEDGSEVRLLAKSENDSTTVPLDHIKAVKAVSIYYVVLELDRIWPGGD